MKLLHIFGGPLVPAIIALAILACEVLPERFTATPEVRSSGIAVPSQNLPPELQVEPIPLTAEIIDEAPFQLFVRKKRITRRQSTPEPVMALDGFEADKSSTSVDGIKATYIVSVQKSDNTETAALIPSY